MRKQPNRQVIYSKNKSTSEIRRCKRINCNGCEKHYENFLETTSRQTHSNEKSPAQRIKQFSQPKLQNARSARDRQVEELLRAENRELTEKLNDKKKKLSKTRLQLKKCEEQLQEAKLLLEQLRSKSTEKQHQKKSENEKNLFQNVMESQNLARQTLEKYRILEEEYRKYRQTSDKKVSDVRKEMAETLKKQTEQSDERVTKLRSQYEDLIGKLKEEHTASLRRLKSQLAEATEKSRNSELIRQLRNEVRELQRTNKQLRLDIENREDSFQSKERNFKENLNRITERVEGWSGEVGKVRELEQSNKELLERYERLLEKYKLRKIRQKQLSREWAEIFREFLQQVGRMKRELDGASQVTFK